MDEYNRSVITNQINKKKKQREDNQLKQEYDRLKKQINQYQLNLQIEINPVVHQLAQKKFELETLEQTEEIALILCQLLKGNSQNILELNEKQFTNSAAKIFIIKTVLDSEINVQSYKIAKSLIQKKYDDLRYKIREKFEASYIKADAKSMKEILSICIKFNLIDEISECYIKKIFSNINPTIFINLEFQEEVIRKIKDFFFTEIQKGFERAFLETDDDNKKIQHQLFNLFGEYSENILNSLINYAFQNNIKVFINNVLKSSLPSEYYLVYLEVFYDQIKSLIHEVEALTKQQSVFYLIDNYTSSLFQQHQDYYIVKQLGYLRGKFEKCGNLLTSKLGVILDLPVHKKKFDWRKWMDYKIEQTEKLSSEDVSAKIESIREIFTDINLQTIFQITNKALLRNVKISKFNEKQKNMVEILKEFLIQITGIIETLIKHTASIIPTFGRKTPLNEDLFEIIPYINTMIKRIELIFQQFGVQKSDKKEARLINVEKEELINNCQAVLTQMVEQALASILKTQNQMLKQIKYVVNKSPKKNERMSSECNKLIHFSKKYLIKIKKFLPQKKIIEKRGEQFVNLLIQHYGELSFNRSQIYQILLDINNFTEYIESYQSQNVKIRYNSFKSLVYIYLLETIPENYKDELIGIQQKIFQKYLENKKRNST